MRLAQWRAMPASFWWLWCGLLINASGTFVLPFLALYLAGRLHYSVLLVGVVLGIFGVGSIAAALLSGVLADRFGRRPTLLVAQLATAMLTVVLLLARSPAIMAGLILGFAIAINLPNPAMRALLVDVVAPTQRPTAFALTDWAGAIGRTVAPAIAGFIATSSYQALFVADAATTAIFAAIVYLRIPESRPASSFAQEAVGTRAGKGPFRDWVLLGVVGLNTLVALAYFQSQSTLPIVMSASGLGPRAYGITLSISSLIVIVLQLPMTAILTRFSRDLVLAGSALTVGLGFGFMAFATTLPAYLSTVAVWTIGTLGLGPFTLALVGDLSPSSQRGRYQSAYQLSWSTARLLGPASGSFTLAELGSRALWAACFIVCAAASLGHLLSIPARRRRLG